MSVSNVIFMYYILYFCKKNVNPISDTNVYLHFVLLLSQLIYGIILIRFYFCEYFILFLKIILYISLHALLRKSFHFSQ